MSSKNTSVVLRSLNRHFQRVSAEKKENIEKIEEVEAYESEKISALAVAVDAFESLLDSIEFDTAESKSWRRTLKQARAFLEDTKK